MSYYNNYGYNNYGYNNYNRFPSQSEMFMKSEEWFLARKEFIIKNKHQTHCPLCGKRFAKWIEENTFKENDRGRSVDHIIPKSIDFSKALDEKNFMLMCWPCNKTKGVESLKNAKKMILLNCRRMIYSSYIDIIMSGLYGAHKRYPDLSLDELCVLLAEWDIGMDYVRSMWAESFSDYADKRLSGEMELPDDIKPENLSDYLENDRYNIFEDNKIIPILHKVMSENLPLVELYEKEWAVKMKNTGSHFDMPVWKYVLQRFNGKIESAASDEDLKIQDNILDIHGKNYDHTLIEEDEDDCYEIHEYKLDRPLILMEL